MIKPYSLTVKRRVPFFAVNPSPYDSQGRWVKEGKVTWQNRHVTINKAQTMPAASND